MVLVVENSRNAGCGRITFDWSSRVSLPETSSTRWMTNITSGRPASYSSKHERGVGLQRVGQDALAELGHLLAVLQHDRVLADEIDAADVAVEVDADAGPVQPRGDLLDVRRLAGAVVALDHHAAVVLEAGQDGERHVPIEHVVGVEIGHVVVGLGVGGHLEIGVDAEQLAHGHLHVRQAGHPGLGLGWHIVSVPDVLPVLGAAGRTGWATRFEVSLGLRPAQLASDSYKLG